MMAWRSCSVLLSLGAGGASRSTAARERWRFSVQQRCGFRKAARKPESPKVEEKPGHAHSKSSEAPPHRRSLPTPQWEQQAPPSSPRSFSRLLRPLIFTVGFTGCSFGSAAILQYESLKSRVQTYFNEIQADWLEKLRPQKQGDIRRQINQWWNSLSEGQRTVTGIIVANVLVLCCWRLPSLHSYMVQYFFSNPASRTLCAPMILSTFSHISFLHLAMNMYVLWSFSTSAVSMLGREQFLAMYLSGGVVSSFVSYVGKMASGRMGPSLGASGSIMAVLAAVCTKMPEAKLAIIFLPMFTFTAANALKAIVALDSAGLVLGWKYFDHAAHLGGTLFGIWYILMGHELLWKNREPLVKLWHDMRTRGGGR